MLPANQSPSIPLPRGWSPSVKRGILHVISLAQYAMAYTRGWAVNSVNDRVRLKAEPARAFLVMAATIASWMARLDEDGPDALVQTRTPVNRFPDLVRYIVQRLKVLCPSTGKAKIAETLARAGLHLGATTVGRMPKEEPQPEPKPVVEQQAAGWVVTSKYPNHLWLVDLTTMPTGLGLWCSWLPFALPQRRPFCHWLAIVVDHFSRCVIGFGVFREQPTSEQVRAVLGRAIGKARATPRHLVTDKGKQFYCHGFKAWCERRKIKPRFGAVGKQGSMNYVAWCTSFVLLAWTAVERDRWDGFVPFALRGALPFGWSYRHSFLSL